MLRFLNWFYEVHNVIDVEKLCKLFSFQLILEEEKTKSLHDTYSARGV